MAGAGAGADDDYRGETGAHASSRARLAGAVTVKWCGGDLIWREIRRHAAPRPGESRLRRFS